MSTRSSVCSVIAKMSGASGIVDVIYRKVFRRTSTFLLAIVAGGFFFERAFNKTGDVIFENWNRGKLWKDIKHQYENKAPAIEEAPTEE
ncbi:hypothetical protein BV898_04884 [Hypsibius exemplaris]|uniref:Cytochrome b-c1 complex subunit 9 n=1 Tax=Hypsibius exemplaris TaxID=2072580 RepID=A0A1W0X0Y9_HYPEX|nr:hypothetical protein BV898_04884 [Hypsibius exemplaris]